MYKEKINTAIRLFALTLVVPISFTALIICLGILGLETNTSFLQHLKSIWIGYYFTGNFIGIDAWRWQLLIFCFCLFVSFFYE